MATYSPGLGLGDGAQTDDTYFSYREWPIFGTGEDNCLERYAAAPGCPSPTPPVPSLQTCTWLPLPIPYDGGHRGAHVLRRKHVRAAQACDSCRQRKAKCDEARPGCGHCEANSLNCTYRDVRPIERDKQVDRINDKLDNMSDILSKILKKHNGFSSSMDSHRRESEQLQSLLPHNKDAPDFAPDSSVDEAERILNTSSHAPPPRRGRGQRKNKTYWNSKRFEPDLNSFERECLFGDEEGALKVPAVAQLDSWGDTSFCISMRYLKTLGRLHEMSTQFRDPNTDSHEGRSMRFQGVVRNLPFRIRGTSITFRKDFYVSDTLNDLVDVVFGRRFMASEFKLLFEKAGRWFATAKETISDYSSPLMSPMAEMASNLPRKIVNFASEAGRQTIEYFSSGSSTPSPPYSLEDVCDLAAKLDPFSRHEPLEAAQSLSAPL